ncbi:hypothetical protein DERP_012094 [Dermatophagoides pteronyssinus]|uniref:Uncharacterized protein n=1 Tax=Dermatophagoides pteronyssinus TaxID=6956 RepID=A0ABQ8ITX8_DERPT|nr:hypothetical protein DERP_012094 [Dermatophagoides pteronyssinus]
MFENVFDIETSILGEKKINICTKLFKHLEIVPDLDYETSQKINIIESKNIQTQKHHRKISKNNGTIDDIITYNDDVIASDSIVLQFQMKSHRLRKFHLLQRFIYRRRRLMLIASIYFNRIASLISNNVILIFY